MSPMPADADSLASSPSRDCGTDRVDEPDDFMSRYSRILNARPCPLFDQRIAVTNATSLHLDSHPSALWFGNFPLDQFQRPLRLRNLHCTHFFRHTFLSVCCSKKQDSAGRTKAASKIAQTCGQHEGRSSS